MKHLIYILFFLTLSFTACGRHTAYPPAMQQAEALMNTRPDSALTLLEAMADTLAMLPEETRMYHQLLTIQAKDKLYITHTSDSLINRIVAFYEAYGNSDRLMMAYFYQGSTYRDMNDAPRALKAFQQAVDLNVPNLDLLAKTYNQMGKLFMYQGLNNEVIRVNRKSIEIYLLQGKRNKISYAQRDIARMYDIKNMPDSALHYYMEACNTALADGDSIRYYNILSELGGYYYEIKEVDKAKQILLLCKELDYIDNKTHIYSMLGHVYKHEQQEDSANFYYLKAAANGDIYQAYNNYKHSFMMSNKEGNYAEAVNYIKKALTLKDSIDKITQTETITKINSLYNYQHTETENMRLQFNQEKQKNMLYITSFVALLAILTSVFLAVYHEMRKKQALYERNKREQIENEKYERSQKALQDNLQKISELEKMIDKSNQEKNQLDQVLLQTRQKKLEAQNESIIQQQKEKELLLKKFQQTELYQEIWTSSTNEEGNPDLLNNPAKWIALQQSIDEIYPHFTDHLKELNPHISHTELQVCWLTKAGISPSGIARVLNKTKQAITNIRSRLIKKFRFKEESRMNFDQFIEEL